MWVAEQREYELIRSLMLFGDPADGRSEETGAASGRTLRRKVARVEANTGELRSVGRPRLLGTSHPVAQPRLFGLDALGEAGWLKALRVGGYAPRAPRERPALQEALFRYAEAL